MLPAEMCFDGQAVFLDAGYVSVWLCSSVKQNRPGFEPSSTNHAGRRLELSVHMNFEHSLQSGGAASASNEKELAHRQNLPHV